MPFFLRKSLRLGPLRLNLSKSGLGISAGVKGARVGTGPRGPHVHAGRGGLYYRKSLGGGGAARGDTRRGRPTTPAAPARLIDSGPVECMANANSVALLEAMRARSGFLARLLRGRFTLRHGLAPEATRAYEELRASFQALADARLWHIEGTTPVEDPKHNAGVSETIARAQARLSFVDPPPLRTGLEPPMLPAGRQCLWFLPAHVLVGDGGRYGAVALGELRVDVEEKSFVEQGPVPPGASIVGTTWRHGNKDGGPDRRFKDNVQHPILATQVFTLSSESGLNECFQTEAPGAATRLAEALAAMARHEVDVSGE